MVVDVYVTISCTSKSGLVLPFGCPLTRVVRDKIQEGRKWLCVCVYDTVSGCQWHCITA